MHLVKVVVVFAFECGNQNEYAEICAYEIVLFGGVGSEVAGSAVRVSGIIDFYRSSAI